MAARLTLVIAIFLGHSSACSSQQTVKGAENLRFYALRISPSNNQILALPFQSDHASDVVLIYDRQDGRMRTVAKYGSNAEKGGHVNPLTSAFSSDGRDFFVGGANLFGAWDSATLYPWFMRQGIDEITSLQTVKVIASPHNGDKIAYSLISHLEPQNITECRAVVWNLKSRTKQEVAAFSKKGITSLVWFDLCFTRSADGIAHYCPETRELVIVDVSKPIPKEVAKFDVQVDPIMQFSRDERTLWALTAGKLIQYDPFNRKIAKIIDLGYNPGWFYVAADGVLVQG